MDAPSEIKILDLDHLDEAPVGAGLYAWYLVPVAADTDWEADIDDEGNDVGYDTFAAFLSSHTRRYLHPGARTTVKWHLWAEWSGMLQETGIEALANMLAEMPERGTQAAKLRTVAKTAATRQVLAAVLLAAAPRLVAPVYIGVSKTLRKRLEEHAAAYLDASDRLARDADLPGSIKNTFGSRIAQARVPYETLRVCTLEIEGFDTVDEDDAREIAEAAEFVLNRWHHPLFGER